MPHEYLFISFFRALAAYWVLVAHCMIWGGWYFPPLPPPKLAVDLFMMISGFLMVAHATERADREPLDRFGNWVRFWMRRFFRIAPAYYVSLAVAVILGSTFLDGYQAWIELNPEKWQGVVVYDPTRIEYTPANILAHVTFVFGLHPTLSFSTFLPDWSLALEMQFYAAFPLLWLLFRRFGPGLAAAVLAAVSLAGKAILLRHVVYYEPSLLILKLPWFLAGMVLYDVVRPSASAPRRWGLLVIGVLLASAEPGYRAWLPVLPALFLAMAAIGSLEVARRLPSDLRRVLASPLVGFASDTSYGVYLFHGFFISAGGLMVAASPTLRALGGLERVLALLAFVTIGSFATAAIVRRYVELPGIAFGRWAMDRVVPPDAPRAAVPSAFVR